MKIQKNIFKLLPNIIISIIVLVLGLLFLQENQRIIIIVITILIIILPYFLKKYNENRKIGKIEDIFAVFLRDFIETVRGGLTIPVAFELLSKNDYGVLTYSIKKISAQLKWGISVEKALMTFSKSTNSKLIGRIISSVIESHKYGGKIIETFEALNNTITEIHKLKEERKLFLSSQIITSYIIFFVFLGIILSLENFLIPNITSNLSFDNLFSTIQINTEKTVEEFENIFRGLILIQGLFAGLVIGKISEGKLIAGVKHSLIMIIISIIVFLIFG